MERDLKEIRRRTSASSPSAAGPAGDAPTGAARTVHLNNAEANLSSSFPSNYSRSTRYTWWNFVPKNLLEQFRRLANFFFLLCAVITLIPALTPITPYTTIVPLVLVLVVSGARDAYDDYRRLLHDRKWNERTYKA